MNAIKITTQNEMSAINVERPFYKTLEPIVGGGIEIVRPKGLPRPYVMIVDDEGLLKDKPTNYIGSLLYETHKHGSPIAGDIVVMREEFGSDGYNLAELSEQDITFCAPFFLALIAEFNSLFNEYPGLRENLAQSEGGTADAAQDLFGLQCAP